MKVSELIARLAEMLEEHGDMIVCLESSETVSGVEAVTADEQVEAVMIR